MSILSDLDRKEVSVGKIVKMALGDEQVLSELLNAVFSKKDTIRYNSFKILKLVSEEHPKALYPEWDFFAELLDSDNTYRRLIAVRIIANLTEADTKNEFEKIFDKYYNLFNDSVIVAGHLATNSGKIAKAKPKLQIKITNKLLNIDKTNQKHKDLVKAYAIEAFDEYFDGAENKEEILEFVKEQLDCGSPKARKKAKDFLKKWGNLSETL